MIKKIIRHLVVNVFSLYTVSLLAQGLVFEKGVTTMFMAGLGLTVVSMLVKPIINILLLPINLVTFNLFRWVTSTIALYLVTLVVPGFQIAKFAFAGMSSKWLDLPALNFQGVLAFISFSFLISLITALIYWLIN